MARKFSIRKLLRGASPSKRMGQPEEHLQQACNQYLELLRARYIHLPKRTTQRLWDKRLGVPAHVAAEASRALKGVPDLIIFGKDGACLLVELKSGKGVLTKEQKEWLGYGLLVIRDFNSFKAKADAWLEEHGGR